MGKFVVTLFASLSLSAFAFDLTLIDKEGNKHTFTQEQLLEIDQHELTTVLPWIEGDAIFSGVYVQDLVNSADLDMPEQVTFVALNDYKVTIPSSDFETFKPIFAIYRDGKEMSVKDKGPYWIVYPLSDMPELNEPDTHAKMIWQIKEVHF
ncbi:hypothetical protein RCJ22_18935 [Vibrio sp. FNV 38]|nr:hypothetical protein [Vibrio sp. FNV 38]